MDELLSITEVLREQLRTRTDSAQATFDLWFGDFILTSLTEDTARFSTPTKLRKKILTSRYFSIIKSTLEEIIGFPVELEIYSLEEEKEPEKISLEDDKIKIHDSKREETERHEKEIADILKSNGTIKNSLIEEYTFDNFIEGTSNKFAKAACYAVAREPCYYNPLFIYGNSGLGKTHLLYAIMNYMKENHKDLNIVYKKSETFLNELVEALSTGKQADFKEKYRTADVLLIDDIQFIAGKPATQEEFFHTFSALYENEKQIIMTSDRPPKEIKPLTDRLQTRFEGGLIADVQPPSIELRTAIIKKKCIDIGLEMKNDDLHYVAERLNSNIRQIEGVLKRLYAIYSFSGAGITRENIEEVISVVDPGNVPNEVMVERIIRVVCKKYGVTEEDIKSKKKTDTVTNARQVAIYFIRKNTDLSLDEIGKIFGRDHSTVIYSLNKIDLNMKTVKFFDSEIDAMASELSV